MLHGTTPDNQELRPANKIANGWYLLLGGKVFATFMDRWEGMGSWVPHIAETRAPGFPLGLYLSCFVWAADVTCYSRFLVVTYIQPAVA